MNTPECTFHWIFLSAATKANALFLLYLSCAIFRKPLTFGHVTYRKQQQPIDVLSILKDMHLVTPMVSERL